MYYSELVSKLCKADINVQLYTTKNILDTVKIPSSVNINICNSKRKFLYLFKQRKKIKSTHLIIFDEPYSYDLYLAYYLFIGAKKILTVHNARQWFKFSIPSFAGFLKTIHHFLFIKLNVFNNFIVVNPNIKAYILDRKRSAHVFFISFGNFSRNVISKKSSFPISIVIPGMIDEKRRDYELIISVLNSFSDFEIRKKIEFIFLGKPKGKYGEYIISELEDLKTNQGFNIKYFKQYIAQDLYESLLEQSDFILSNLNAEIYTDYGFKEIYGQTKETGIASAAIEYEKPLISAKKDILPEEFRQAVIPFNSKNELKQVLSEIAENKISHRSYVLNYKKAKSDYFKKINVEFENLIEFIRNNTA